MGTRGGTKGKATHDACLRRAEFAGRAADSESCAARLCPRRKACMVLRNGYVWKRQVAANTKPTLCNLTIMLGLQLEFQSATNPSARWFVEVHSGFMVKIPRLEF